MNPLVIFADTTGGDFCSTAFLVLILVGVGDKMVRGSETLRSVGVSIAGGVFLLLCCFGWMDQDPDAPDGSLSIVLSALGQAGMALGFSWIALAVLAHVHARTIGAAVATANRWADRSRLTRDQNRRRREEERLKRLSQAEYERQAPDRERAQRQAETQKQVDAEAQGRREEACARCEMFYNLHGADIGERFTQKMFDDYLQKYMGGNRPPDYVEERGKRLLETLQKALDTVKPQPKFRSLAEINASRQEERRVITEADLDDEVKESQLVRLENKYDELFNRFFEEKSR